MSFLITPPPNLSPCQVTLLYPAVMGPVPTGPGSPGWVRVRENGVSYSFDMLRVMFSSGNVSEKTRWDTPVLVGR
jgi:hypothetical protein